MLPSETHIFSPEAVAFLEKLHRRFREQRLELLAAREARQQRIHRGEMPHFLPETEEIRTDLSWKVAPIPKDLKKRTVEITGPVSRKMMINALNSGADVFMADFEDANSPTWENVIEGQQNCFDAVRKSISFKTAEKEYTLAQKTATLLVNPRGWHLIEKYFQV
ncbi:MAG: malate synthase A, partial [Chlamydiia bacterium]|nr:malate synthase A [Chlamydiia bacterium]